MIDFEGYSHIPKRFGRLADVHSVGEIDVPGSAGDDPEVHPAFPVAGGHLADASASDDEGSTEELPSTVDDLQADVGETLLSSQRAISNGDLDNNAGGVDGVENDETELGQQSIDQDCWAIHGDFLVRRHSVPRTFLFSLLDCPEVLLPIPLKTSRH